MHTENSILIHAPAETIFETAADLSLWPTILPHYRWIRFLEKSPARNVVTMAANRKIPALLGIQIPVQWTSEQEIDRKNMEIRFHHLTAFTKGMRVVWTFTSTANGVEVRIRHDLKPTIPIIGKFIAKTIIGEFFVSYIANQTLYHMKQYVEQHYGAQ
ncbi:MAG: SRPBCC family protein [Ignavibacteriales bacterium]|nr:SRPBCC family protein [Ignavibacteriales bacterium]